MLCHSPCCHCLHANSPRMGPKPPPTPLPALQPLRLEPQAGETQILAGKGSGSGPCHPNTKCVRACLRLRWELGWSGGADTQPPGSSVSRNQGHVTLPPPCPAEPKSREKELPQLREEAHPEHFPHRRARLHLRPWRIFSPGASPAGGKGSSCSRLAQVCLTSLPLPAAATWRPTPHHRGHPRGCHGSCRL